MCKGQTELQERQSADLIADAFLSNEWLYLWPYQVIGP